MKILLKISAFCLFLLMFFSCEKKEVSKNSIDSSQKESFQESVSLNELEGIYVLIHMAPDSYFRSPYYKAFDINPYKRIDFLNVNLASVLGSDLYDAKNIGLAQNIGHWEYDQSKEELKVIIDKPKISKEYPHFSEMKKIMPLYPWKVIRQDGRTNIIVHDADGKTFAIFKNISEKTIRKSSQKESFQEQVSLNELEGIYVLIHIAPDSYFRSPYYKAFDINPYKRIDFLNVNLASVLGSDLYDAKNIGLAQNIGHWEYDQSKEELKVIIDKPKISKEYPHFSEMKKIMPLYPWKVIRQDGCTNIIVRDADGKIFAIFKNISH